ncbi:uncharacterized protein EV420DRAFT_1650820 [Desarmillaria tabescens]|uniref:RING-type domain-containing protein n=1 Tax=Armillaria tabescens TaxID=1929756 RepID=A0AA39JE71_ARMTA|nr:uncharacterized protein EV420DRAFT_1650820 [Desarmillaria tabescens]KAK0439704.1 hypothetical protein EV420DRAFT_1650820 [Desarmillaria tabescens]
MSSSSPPRKHIKLQSPSPPPETQDEEGDNCGIYSQPLVDWTIIPTCSHEFCFDCLIVWADQSRKCPLCAQTMGEYLIHRIRSLRSTRTVRSPFKDLFVYDSIIQYNKPPHVSSPPRPRLRLMVRARRAPPVRDPGLGHQQPATRLVYRLHLEIPDGTKTMYLPSGRYPGPLLVRHYPSTMDTPASTPNIIELSRPRDVRGNSRATDLTVKGKSRANTPCLSPEPSNILETSRAQSKKPIRMALDSLRAHLGATSASSSSSPSLLSCLSSSGERRKRENNSADMPCSQSASDQDQSSAEKKEDLLTEGRARLLGKLLEERRHAAGGGRRGGDIDDAERRLRTRALVRVRLAAEKQARE